MSDAKRPWPQSDTEERITSTVTQFIRRSGLGRTKVYEMLAAGQLESAKLGATRVIIEDSYHRLLAQNRVPPKHSTAAD